MELHDGTGTLIASNDDWQHTIIGWIITETEFVISKTAATLQGTQGSQR